MTSFVLKLKLEQLDYSSVNLSTKHYAHFDKARLHKKNIVLFIQIICYYSTSSIV